MDRRALRRLIAIMMLAGCWLGSVSAAATAQDCEAMPKGPARTDCYLIRSRIAGGNADIAATKARIATDAARLRAVTGASPTLHSAKGKPKPRKP